MMTTLDLKDDDWNNFKSYCKENGMSLKGLFVLGANKIIEENARKRSNEIRVKQEH